MQLILTITNASALDNGQPVTMRLDRHGAIIGRSALADWSLPDPRNYVSSTHCEIDFVNGGYVLTDKSTNGTFVNGNHGRLTQPYPLKEGDVFQVGHYQIQVRIEATAAAAPAASVQAGGAAGQLETGGWGSWDVAKPPPTAEAAGWGRPEPQAAISGLGAMSQSWAAPKVEASPSAWDTPAPPPTPPASAWASATPAAHAPSGDDVWGKLSSGAAVDWSRAGFGASASQPAGDPFGLSPPAPPADPLGLGAAAEIAKLDPLAVAPASAAPAPVPAAGGWGAAAPPSPPADSWGAPEWSAPAWAPQPPPTPVQTQPAPSLTKAEPAPLSLDWAAAAPEPAPAAPQPTIAPQAQPAPPSAAAPPVAPSGGEWAAFAAAAGLNPADLKASPPEAMTAAGGLLRRLVAGLIVMLEARARAKAQLGAQSTLLEIDGNNPLKFARSPERALAQLLNPPERGFMSAERTVEDSFHDLQAHQMATLAAMQGALRATLDRFSPTAIRARAETRGILARILPTGRDATLWQAYEREFEGVAKGSDEAFMDVFAKEFRQAYEKAAAEMRRR